MTRVVVSDAASCDQADILRDLTVKAGARTATKYANLFGRLFDLLTDHPGIGARLTRSPGRQRRRSGHDAGGQGAVTPRGRDGLRQVMECASSVLSDTGPTASNVATVEVAPPATPLGSTLMTEPVPDGVTDT